ncbi:MAG: polysaccharide biosynthesis tyrosine autokinase [Cyanobacteria bacterium J06627_28]
MINSSSRTALSPFRRHWWIAIPAFLATMGGALAYLTLVPRTYEATVRLSVEDERTSVSSLGQTLTETEEVGGANPIVTQAEVVRSQGVLRAALDRYRASRGQSSAPDAAASSAGRPSPQAGANGMPTVDSLAEDLIVNIVPATNIVEMTYRSQDPLMAADLVNAVAQEAVNQNTEDINLEASAVREFLESRIRPLQARLQQAEQAESLYRQTNGVIDVDAQNRQLVTSLAELEQEERALAAALEEVTTRDRRLQDVTGITSPETAYDIARVGQDPQLQTLQAQITTAATQLAEARSRLGDLHPELLALTDEFNSLQSLYQQRLSQISPEGLGGVAAALSSNDLSQDLIAQSINSSIESEALANRLALVQRDLVQVRSFLVDQPAVQQPLAVLTREREDAAESLELIRTKLEEARIAEAQLVSNVRIIGRAEPDLNPVSPKPFAVLALGAIAGAILSVGAILLLDLFDASLQSGEEVEKLVKLPVLGYLPRLSADLVDIAGLDAFLDSPRHVEPYRALLKTIESRQRMREVAIRNGATAVANGAGGRSTLEGGFFADGRSSAVQTPQVVVVSSPTSNEGTSSVATCLGAVSAMLGRRTLIIEANPINPVQHLYLQVESHPGLTDVVNHAQPLSSAVKLTTIGRLSVLPYGPALNRPSTVTESAAMRVLLGNLVRDYDLILIDTAPVDSSADAVTMSQMTDGLLLVTRPGYTPRSVLADTVQQLRKSGAPLLGIAMNETILPEEQLGRLPAARQVVNGAGRTVR